MNFTSLASFAAHLESAAIAQAMQVQSGLDRVAEHIKKTAKGKLGEYQDAVEHFDEWAPLADATVQHHVQVIVDGEAASDAGPNTPLLLTGEMRDSIGKEVHPGEAIIGSTADEAVYQELGTDKIPPRPFLGPAAVESEDVIREEIGAACVGGLLGRGMSPGTQLTRRIVQ